MGRERLQEGIEINRATSAARAFIFQDSSVRLCLGAQGPLLGGPAGGSAGPRRLCAAAAALLETGGAFLPPPPSCPAPTPRPVPRLPIDMKTAWQGREEQAVTVNYMQRVQRQQHRALSRSAACLAAACTVFKRRES